MSHGNYAQLYLHFTAAWKKIELVITPKCKYIFLNNISKFWIRFAINQEYIMFTSKAEKSAKFPPLSVEAVPNGSSGDFA